MNSFSNHPTTAFTRTLINSCLRRECVPNITPTKEVGKGTGLGLYICHEIIQRHGGSITIKKPDGEGAGFVVKLPVNP